MVCTCALSKVVVMSFCQQSGHCTVGCIYFHQLFRMKPYFFLCVRIHEKTLPDFFQIFKLISSGCTSALKWTQLTLNGLNKKKLQFSRYSNETCFIQLYSSRQLIWAIVEPDWTEIERVMFRWKNINLKIWKKSGSVFSCILTHTKK